MCISFFDLSLYAGLIAFCHRSLERFSYGYLVGISLYPYFNMKGKSLANERLLNKFSVLYRIVLVMLNNEISSGIYASACKSHGNDWSLSCLQPFKPQTKPNRFVIRIESFTWLQAAAIPPKISRL